MRASWINSIGIDRATDNFIRRKDADTDGATCEQSRGQGWGSTPVNKETPMITSKDQKLGTKCEMRSPCKVNVQFVFSPHLI